MPKGNRIKPQNCSTRKAIFARMKTSAVSTDMFISASYQAIFPIIEILAYGLGCVALLRDGIEVLGPCCTSAIGVAYLVAGGIKGVIRGITIPSGCRVAKISSGSPKVAV